MFSHLLKNFITTLSLEYPCSSTQLSCYQASNFIWISSSHCLLTNNYLFMVIEKKAIAFQNCHFLSNYRNIWITPSKSNCAKLFPNLMSYCNIFISISHVITTWIYHNWRCLRGMTGVKGGFPLAGRWFLKTNFTCLNAWGGNTSIRECSFQAHAN